jgi:hypothetical protein
MRLSLGDVMILLMPSVKKLAKTLGMKGYSKMKKDNIIYEIWEKTKGGTDLGGLDLSKYKGGGKYHYTTDKTPMEMLSRWAEENGKPKPTPSWDMPDEGGAEEPKPVKKKLKIVDKNSKLTLSVLGMLEYMKKHTADKEIESWDMPEFDDLTKQIYKKYKSENPSGDEYDVTEEYSKIFDLVVSGDSYSLEGQKILGDIVYFNSNGVEINRREIEEEYGSDYEGAEADIAGREYRLGWDYDDEKEAEDLFDALKEFISGKKLDETWRERKEREDKEQEVALRAKREENRRRDEERSREHNNKLAMLVKREYGYEYNRIRRELEVEFMNPKLLDKLAELMVSIPALGLSAQTLRDADVADFNVEKMKDEATELLLDVLDGVWLRSPRKERTKIIYEELGKL